MLVHLKPRDVHDSQLSSAYRSLMHRETALSSPMLGMSLMALVSMLCGTASVGPAKDCESNSAFFCRQAITLCQEANYQRVPLHLHNTNLR